MYDKIHMNRYKNTYVPIPVVTSFFLSEDGRPIFMLFPIIADAIKTPIINAIEAQRLSSPSIDSKRNVAITPPIAAMPILIQNSLSSSLLRRSSSSWLSLGCATSGVLSSVGSVGDFFFGCFNEISKGDSSVSGLKCLVALSSLVRVCL